MEKIASSTQPGIRWIFQYAGKAGGLLEALRKAVGRMG